MSPEEKIRKTIETGNVSHAYIFEGSRISGKETAAKSFIAAVKEQFPAKFGHDVKIYDVVSDKGNWFKIYDTFDFASSRQRVESSIRSK